MLIGRRAQLVDLIAEFGGCGAQFTEMLSGRALLKEDLQRSPYVKRRAVEKTLFYQLMLRPDDPVDREVDVAQRALLELLPEPQHGADRWQRVERVARDGEHLADVLAGLPPLASHLLAPRLLAPLLLLALAQVLAGEHATLGEGQFGQAAGAGAVELDDLDPGVVDQVDASITELFPEGAPAGSEEPSSTAEAAAEQ